MNRSTALARVLVDELVRGGVAEAVLSPGSRNAPLSYALHDAGRLRLHVRVDERSAGFLALGLARASGRPVPVITTSGTAVANLHPAVLEASYSGVPLLVLSADRPPELVGTGANQTIEQAGLFGAAVRLAAVAAGDEPERWRATVCRVLAAATGARTGDPGPVQLDVPLAEPLMPDGDGVPAGRDGGGPWTTVAPVSVDAPVPVDVGVPTLVIAGADAVSHPELARVPTVAEPGFALPPEVGVHPLAVAELSPEQVIVLGRPTLHRDVGRLLASGVPVTVLAPGRGWTDVAATAHAVGTRAQVHGASPPDWLLAAGSASVAARERVRAVLDADGPVTGLHVARAVVESVRPDELVVLGSSNPVRDVSLVGNPTSRVLANRGVAGIDGTVSTAIGAALAHGGPTVALLGDLTLLHDANGLLIGPDEPRPNLTIVVADDDGGGIFTTLEQGAPERSAAFERVFGTPHGTDIGSLCRAHGVAHERVDVARLIIRLVDLYDGIRILEVPTHRSTRRQLHDALL